MKLTTNTLKNLTISAGIATALAGSVSAKDIELRKPKIAICKAAPIKSESKTIKAFFTTADINKDGKLSAEEFNKVFAQNKLPEDIPDVEIAAEPIAASKLLVHCNFGTPAVPISRLPRSRPCLRFEPVHRLGAFRP